jgi:hypothetical protein
MVLPCESVLIHGLIFAAVYRSTVEYAPTIHGSSKLLSDVGCRIRCRIGYKFVMSGVLLSGILCALYRLLIPWPRLFSMLNVIGVTAQDRISISTVSRGYLSHYPLMPNRIVRVTEWWLYYVMLDDSQDAFGVRYSWYRPIRSRICLMHPSSRVPMSALSSAWCWSLGAPCPLLRCYGDSWQCVNAHEGYRLLPGYRGSSSSVVKVSVLDSMDM